MRTKRGMFGAIILSLFLTIILQIITTDTVIKYNWIVRIMTGICYYTIFIFIIVDICMAISDKYLYYVYSTVTDICLLGIVILILNLFTKIETLKYGLQIIFLLLIIANVFKILAQKNKPDNWDKKFRE